METIESLRQLLAYNQWANRKTIESIRNHQRQDPKALRALTHLLVAEREWLLRLREGKDTTGFNFWPELSLANLERLASELQIEYARLLNAVSEEDLEVPPPTRTAGGWNTGTNIVTFLRTC